MRFISELKLNNTEIYKANQYINKVYCLSPWLFH